MARIFSKKDDPRRPQISRQDVAEFFEERARKSMDLGPVRAVIYQDKNPELAVARDAAEKHLLFPKLALDKTRSRVLDIGCGTGRWASVLVNECAYYHGIDLSPGLIEIARKAYGEPGRVEFTVTSIDEMDLERMGLAGSFDRALCMGVLIYLNDDELAQALQAMERALAASCRFIVREPIATEARLTIKEHFSEEMAQAYNAIYRTEAELLELFERFFYAKGFSLAGSGDVYSDSALNNRRETLQRWYCLER